MRETNELLTRRRARGVRDPALPGHRGDPAHRAGAAARRRRRDRREPAVSARPRGGGGGGRGGDRALPDAAGAAHHRPDEPARGVHRVRAAARRRHRAAHAARRALDGAGRVPGGVAAGRARSTATRSKPTSSRSRGCCWGSSSSRWACRSTSACSRAARARSALLLLGFLTLKIASLWAIGRTLGIPPRSAGSSRRCSRRAASSPSWCSAWRAQARLLPPASGTRSSRSVVRSRWRSRPLLLAAGRPVGSRRARSRAAEPTPYRAEGPVIIAGLRPLRADRRAPAASRAACARPCSTTTPTRSSSLRKFGFRVFYGDATRLDLLHAAGARRRQAAGGRHRRRRRRASRWSTSRASTFPNLADRDARPQREPLCRAARSAASSSSSARPSSRRCAWGAVARAPGYRPLRGARARRSVPAPQRREPERDAAVLTATRRGASRCRQGREQLEHQFARDRELFEREHGGKGW